MEVASALPQSLQDALNGGVLKRMPLTFLPYINQQLHQWEYLFPNEQQATERLVLYIASLPPEQYVWLFRSVTELEDKMGVRQWKFSTNEQTIENSSELARSPFFQEWRRAVQAVFDEADRSVEKANPASGSERRLVLIDIPEPLNVESKSAWKRWQGIGRSITLDANSGIKSQGILEMLLFGGQGREANGLLGAVNHAAQSVHASVWLMDAGKSLVNSALAKRPVNGTDAGTVLLSYARLEDYRQNFSRAMNTMRKDLTDADAVYDRLRNVDVIPWCPPEVAADPAVREFVRSLYLSGNGAVIFGNSFVEWAASEAFRRARPRILAARFGVRSKPKPFTGVAIFENPDQVNPLPAVDDLPGSAIDAQMLALYVWLAATRYPEYQRSTVCVCLAECLAQAYLIAPSEFPLPQSTQQTSTDEFARALYTWIA